MKLYRIIVLHAAPKDSHESTETYLVAKDDDAVFLWIDEELNHNAWTEDDEEYYLDDDLEKEVSAAEWILAMKGDLTSESGYEDAYYGVTKYGWEEVKNATDDDIKTLLRLKIAKKSK